MKLKLIVISAVTLLLASTAFATPILFTLSGSYAFININGVQQPPLSGLPYSHLYIGFYTDTSGFTTHHYTSRYGDSTYFSDTITGAILYDNSGKTPLATITDPIELRIYYPDIGRFTLMNVSTDPDLHDGADLANGTVNDWGPVNDLSGIGGFSGSGYATYGFSANTSAGLLVANSSLPIVSAQLNPASPTSSVPEPSSIALIATGALGFAGLLRRRFECM